MKNSEETRKGKITAKRMQQILETEYGINSYAEFEKTTKESPGLDISIFVSPLDKKDNQSKGAPKKNMY